MKRVRGAVVAAWAARWHLAAMRAAFRAGWRTKGMLRPFAGKLCEACPQGKPQTAAESFWSESQQRDVHLCEWHALKFCAVNSNRAESRAWRRQQRRKGGGSSGRGTAA